MMTLAQFHAARLNKPCDYDGYFGSQCVDLADFYMRDVWGIPVFYVTGAVDLFGHRPDLIEWIVNDVGNVNQHPIAGDMVIWHLDAKIGTGVNGHVDIFLHGDGNNFVGFDCNWPVGAYPHDVQHDYEGVKGWGRRRHAIVVPPVVVPPKPPIPVPPASLNLNPQQAADLVEWMSHITEQKGEG